MLACRLIGIAVWELYIFVLTKMKFSNQMTKHDFDYNSKPWGATETLLYQIILKSINLKVPFLTAPLTRGDAHSKLVAMFVLF